jgi:hypothetical protein
MARRGTRPAGAVTYGANMNVDSSYGTSGTVMLQNPYIDKLSTQERVIDRGP